MVERQLRARGIRDERVLAAMGTVPRELFVPDEERRHAYEDWPLPLGHGQTISQPYMVAVICEQAAVRAGTKVRDVGTGSGYQAAVLAEMGARVHTVERIPELAEQARRNLAAAGYDRLVTVRVADGTLGLPQEAPFDAITVGAAAPERPDALYGQLVARGRIVVPVGGLDGQRLELVVATPEGPAVVRSVPCRFVPLVGVRGYRP